MIRQRLSCGVWVACFVVFLFELTLVLIDRPVQRLAGSLALATLAVSGGASIIRAHDVAATVDAVKVAAAVAGTR